MPSSAAVPHPHDRLLHVDALKAVAAQLIVLHHLSAYGPIADAVQTLLPAVIAGLYRHARLAVQVFLVVGGFLSARALSKRGRLVDLAVPGLLWRRYLRLTLPFMAAVGLSLGCGLLVRPWLPELVPDEVTLAQLLSHALLLQGVLGHDALTAGAWYVAVDFQLFALLILLLWLARRLEFSRLALAWRGVVGPLLVLALATASLWLFNRNPGLDNWGLYFFGAYGLGALLHWALKSEQAPAHLALISAVGLLALGLEWRDRIAVALVAAWLLAALHWHHQRGGLQPLARRRLGRWVGWLGTHSYALFLVHYPVCLLVNALFEQQQMDGGAAGVAMMLLAWGLANLASVPFHRWIERPAGRLRFGALFAGAQRA
ncbi:MAG: acyltransferase [Pelomonas sp.]|nr:acyltransferase [Roseateles sp.]